MNKITQPSYLSPTIIAALFFCTTQAFTAPASNNLVLPARQLSADHIRVVSYNIRGDSAIDRDHNNGWEIRKNKIAYLLHLYRPDIIALVGVSTIYMADIKLLFPAYTIIAFDTTANSKDVALLVHKSRFTIQQTGCFWLSDNPEYKQKPEKPAWGGKNPRIVVHALLEDFYSRKSFFIFGTHFDSSGPQSRINSARVLTEQLAKLENNKSLPLLILGDFNFITSTPEIAALSDQAYAHIVSNNNLRDIRDYQSDHFGPDGTWVGWPYDKYGMPHGVIGERLDHVFLRGFLVAQEGVLDLKVNINGPFLLDRSDFDFAHYTYPSDHLPVMADLLIN